MFKKTSLFIFFCLLMNISESFAEFPQTDHDFSLLPPYCKAKLKPSGDYGIWQKRLDAQGGGFMHVHHYCSALHSINLAQNIPPIDEHNKIIKKRLYENSLGGIQYMEDNADPKFVLFPQIYTTKALALFALNRPIEAVSYLNKAIEKNQKFAKAYGMLADYWIKSGNKKAALDLLNEGLKYSPDSKILLKKKIAASK